MATVRFYRPRGSYFLFICHVCRNYEVRKNNNINNKLMFIICEFVFTDNTYRFDLPIIQIKSSTCHCCTSGGWGRSQKVSGARVGGNLYNRLVVNKVSWDRLASWSPKKARRQQSVRRAPSPGGLGGHGEDLNIWPRGGFNKRVRHRGQSRTLPRRGEDYAGMWRTLGDNILRSSWT